jgi:hypothetical protein
VFFLAKAFSKQATLRRVVCFPSSREFRSPIELFLAGVAEWEPHVARLVLAA